MIKLARAVAKEPRRLALAIWIVSVPSVLADVDVSSTVLERRAPAEVNTEAGEWRNGKHWQLEPTEWQRVELLQREFRQYISDRQISPLEVLGIHARTNSERERYARRWAELMVADAERVLAFQRAYDIAVQDLLNDQPLIDLTQLPPRVSTLPELVATDRLAVFVGRNCVVCDQVVARALQSLKGIDGIDFYFTDLQKGEESQLHRWAGSHRIPPEVVRAGRITLNFDDGLMARVHPRADKVPVVMRRRNDRFESINPWELP